MLRTPHKNRRQEKSLLNKARWAGYAAAGAATVLGAHESAEAGIIYGTLGAKVDGCHGTAGNPAYYAIDFNNDNKNDLEMMHWAYAISSGQAFATGLNGGEVAAKSTGGYRYAYNLAPGDLVNTRQFLGGYATMAMFNGYGNSEFLAPGPGYVGFSFTADDGTHYGWMQVNMDGAAHNAFTLVDYAYAGVGEDITVGQVPEPGSLGLLATGAIGLLLWRRKRRGNKTAA
jgi:hypothetical protein